MTEVTDQNPLSQFRPRRILLPVAIGVGVSLYLIFGLSKMDMSKLSQIPFTGHLVIGLLLALLTVVIRDLAYIYRIWQLTDCKLSFMKCFEVIMLWEFGSSITPASVGGITLALFILKKEKISYGKGTSIIMLCSYLDNIAFVSVFSILFLLLGTRMFDLSATCSSLGDSKLFSGIRILGQYVWIGFIIVAVIGGLLGFAIFVRPGWARGFFERVSKIKILHRWEEKIKLLGEEIWYASREFKTKGFLFSMKVLIATIISWCARYALASALIWTFADGGLNQLDVFARQYVHRMIVMIPTTPGGSGIMEVSFIALNCDFLPVGLAPAVAIIWRLFNFYLYLGIGAIVLPRWIARVNKKAA
ncbi:MAG: hypothetical protein JWO03_3399 [Bacteroidetes bacterium]|nr:hypothetical protein [Bacteroidota bacterium]